MIRTNGIICYSPLCLNLSLVSIRLKYVYSAISIIVDELSANTQIMQSTFSGQPLAAEIFPSSKICNWDHKRASVLSPSLKGQYDWSQNREK